ncbi:MAG TPA: hypothetical protein VIJ29_04750 [Candidatus Paceibacterota bacterium]
MGNTFELRKLWLYGAALDLGISGKSHIYTVCKLHLDDAARNTFLTDRFATF